MGEGELLGNFKINGATFANWFNGSFLNFSLNFFYGKFEIVNGNFQKN